ncbi:prepilin peptidase [Aromatoleum toluolicum]|uniref:Prepilin peptidase n=1 Tax=Aromatoleum toluolicum TaxID=90060 RepID=A0ABX1NKY8_9RHOO|nr:prepilin peptidase [Aromatoleum toluolicum]NMG00009.1 prepilin peptidase [Aromatoleum toluolicum]
MAYLLLCLLALAVSSDLISRKIPNRLVASGIALGVLLQFAIPAGHGPLHVDSSAIGIGPSLGGIAAGLLVMLPLYLLRAMGAGDVKLMMMVGAFLGPLQTLGVAVLTFAAGGVLAIVMALWQRAFRQLILNLRYMLTTSAISAAGGTSPRFEPLQQTAGRMPYAVAIAAGTLLQLILVRSGGWALS